MLYLSYHTTAFIKLSQILWHLASNNNATSAGFENVGQGHHLQNSLCLGYYTKADFNQTLTNMMLLAWQRKRHISWSWKCRSGSHFIESNISAIIKPIWTRFSSRMMTPIPELLRLCVQDLISLPPLHGNTPQTSHLFAVHCSSFLSNHLVCSRWRLL